MTLVKKSTPIGEKSKEPWWLAKIERKLQCLVKRKNCKVPKNSQQLVEFTWLCVTETSQKILEGLDYYVIWYRHSGYELLEKKRWLLWQSLNFKLKNINCPTLWFMTKYMKNWRHCNSLCSTSCLLIKNYQLTIQLNSNSEYGKHYLINSSIVFVSVLMLAFSSNSIMPKYSLTDLLARL